MSARYQNGRGIIVYTPPIDPHYPRAHASQGEEMDVIIPKTFILAVGAKRDRGYFLSTPGIERTIREKGLQDGTFAYVNVEIRLQVKEGALIPIVTRENIRYTREEYGNALGKEIVKRLIGKKVNKEIRRIISVAKQRHHQTQVQKKLAGQKREEIKDWSRLKLRENSTGKTENRNSMREKVTRARRIMQTKAVRAWRALTGRPRPGVRRK